MPHFLDCCHTDFIKSPRTRGCPLLANGGAPENLLCGSPCKEPLPRRDAAFSFTMISGHWFPGSGRVWRTRDLVVRTRTELCTATACAGATD